MESIQTYWFLRHFKESFPHMKYNHNELNKLNFRQVKKLAKKLGYVFDPKK